MKFEAPKNPNYAASVVRIANIIPLENCDNVVATTIFGFQAIVGKNTQVGDLGIVFPAETQLSDAYCMNNNLFRDENRNKDINEKGYIENSRRCKAVKFRGHTSSCLFMPLASLGYILGKKVAQLEEGDTFDFIQGEEICRKYVIKEVGERKNHQAQPKRFNRVDTKFIPEHFDTENYFRNDRNVGVETEIIVTQKLHGTSIRIANTIVLRKLSWRERLAKWFGIKVQETEYDLVQGSRKVIKDVTNPYHDHYYTEDIWSVEGQKLKGLLPENFIIYGELVGFTSDGAELQSSYTYDVAPRHAVLYVYRVAFVNAAGLVTDLSWDQLKEFCLARGLRYVPELWRGKHKDFKVAPYLECRLSDTFDNAIPLSHEGTADEGICIRVDKLTPYILKAKSQKFYEHESSLLDKGQEDLESQESVIDAA